MDVSEEERDLVMILSKDCFSFIAAGRCQRPEAGIRKDVTGFDQQQWLVIYKSSEWAAIIECIHLPLMRQREESCCRNNRKTIAARQSCGGALLSPGWKTLEVAAAWHNLPFLGISANQGSQAVLRYQPITEAVHDEPSHTLAFYARNRMATYLTFFMKDTAHHR
jgi:hypothetical protein